MVTLSAVGFNGHGQLVDNRDEGRGPPDLRQLEAIAESSHTEVLLARWSYTVLKQDNTVKVLGFHNGEACQNLTLPLDVTIESAFADDESHQIGFVSSPDGKLYLLQTFNGTSSLVQQGDGDSPKLSYVAVTATGHTCIGLLQAPASNLVHLIQFRRFDHFHTWFKDPTSLSRDDDYVHHMVPGRIVQLEAGAARFILRTANGELWSWTTDTRHCRCLGRIVSAEAPAAKPAPIEALGGVPIAKVSVGKWMAIALSRDRDAYAWGKDKPAEEQGAITVLPGAEDQVKLIDVNSEADIADVAAGGGHLLVLTADAGRHVYAVGDNYNGQLGLSQEGIARRFEPDWRRLTKRDDAKVNHVWAGDCTSFVLSE